eukprot:TRINITY_DN8152_c0_g1_i2.p1 TRINITY_DN8152_c0_g1~~TRINITY_DN8152_c0_g1_i2.p1  ORF type:complete len:507 (-),score=125.66 TRINITY_DN8152_c0_g1_i2:111-1601(-)
MTVENVSQLPKKANSKKLYVLWKRGKSKEATSRTGVVEASKGTAKWDENVVFKTHIKQIADTSKGKRFAPKNMRISVHYIGRIRNHTIRKTVINLADFVEKGPFVPVRVHATKIAFGQPKKDPVLLVSFTSKWLRLNSKEIVQTQDDEYSLRTADDTLSLMEDTYSAGHSSESTGFTSDDENAEKPAVHIEPRSHKSRKRAQSKVIAPGILELKFRIQQLETELEEALAEKKKVQTTAENKSKKIRSLRRKIAELQESAAPKESTDDDKDASKDKAKEVRRMKRKLAEVQKEVSHCQERNEQQANEIKTLTEKNKKLKESLIKNLSSEVASAAVGGGNSISVQLLQEEKDMLQSQNDKLAEEHKKLQAQCDQFQENNNLVTELQSELEGCKQRKKFFETSVGEKEEEISELLRKIERLETAKEKEKIAEAEADEDNSGPKFGDPTAESKYQKDQIRLRRLGNALIQTGSVSVWGGALAAVLLLFFIRAMALTFIFY